MMLAVLLMTVAAGQDCSQVSFGRLAELLASQEREEQRMALSIIRFCDRDPRTWPPRLCAALERQEGTGDLRSRLVGELFMSFRAPHACEKPALVAALHDPDPTVQVLAARVFASRYPKENVRATPKGWGCSRWKEGCKFSIWKELAGKKLTDANVQQLLTLGRTKKLAGFTSKAGKKFEAKLTLDVATGKLSFVFEDK
jgi:hypothetical protein